MAKRLLVVVLMCLSVVASAFYAAKPAAAVVTYEYVDVCVGTYTFQSPWISSNPVDWYSVNRSEMMLIQSVPDMPEWMMVNSTGDFIPKSKLCPDDGAADSRSVLVGTYVHESPWLTSAAGRWLASGTKSLVTVPVSGKATWRQVWATGEFVPTSKLSARAALPVPTLRNVCSGTPLYKNPWLSSAKQGALTAGMKNVSVFPVDLRPTWLELMGTGEFVPESNFCDIPVADSGSSVAITSWGDSWFYGYAKSAYSLKIRELANRYGCQLATRIAIQSTAPYPGASSNWQGAADMWDNAIVIKRGLTYGRLPYVVAHECGHLMQARAYGSTYAGISRVITDMNRIYGGSHYTGIDRNADCITVARGLTGQYYTSSCSGARWTAAKDIMALRRVTFS